jgi:hypothetical protein
MKKVGFVAAALVFALLIGACDLFLSDFDVEDVVGTWQFGSKSIGTRAADNITVFIIGGEGTYNIDLCWTVASGIDDPSYYEDEHWLNGTVDGDTFSGDYTIYSSDPGLAVYDDGDASYPVTIKLSKVGGKLKLVITGSGPLAGLTFTDGVLQEN